MVSIYTHNLGGKRVDELIDIQRGLVKRSAILQREISDIEDANNRSKKQLY